MGLTDHQKAAKQAGLEALRNTGFAFTQGFAGVGKTWSMKDLVDEWEAEGHTVIGTAPTWAAARRASEATGLRFISNHKLLYSRPNEDEKGRLFFGKPTDQNIPFNAKVLADEGGMMGQKVGGDLEEMCASRNADLWVFGDNFQLGPVRAKRHFGNDRVTATLTEVIRQNPGPGLTMLTDMRNGKCTGYFNIRKYADQKELVDCGQLNEKLVRAFTHKFIKEGTGQFICYYNKTRHAINRKAREHLGFAERTLNLGERLVFLTNTEPVVNSDIGVVVDIEMGIRDHAAAPIQQISPLDMRFVRVTLSDGRRVLISLTCLQQGEEYWSLLNKKIKKLRGGQKNVMIKAMRKLAKCDYAYAITGHKSQGSQFQQVFAILEHSNINWQYTVASRFTDQLMVSMGGLN